MGSKSAQLALVMKDGEKHYFAVYGKTDEMNRQVQEAAQLIRSRLE